MAQQLVDYCRVGYLQIDCGRIGCTGPAKPAALGITINTAGMQPYLVDVEIAVNGRTLYCSPSI